ncbi:protein kinase (macronuclear) [Tetrahymena thermophila SB210]|uniref:Protein kinase n=1 Tax=Tetrahymena thermophila (strain SB210) TaxID=312017 RepID=I7MCK3_TETTS|nr:protein kinase [Tetrahymena thermophila SB210]EAR84111.1 protein kinase [Tetrahymena thermophila SB210]|eukprot:XP_001031774.1 protein kinase [Tetrahymena thermophila SB210]
MSAIQKSKLNQPKLIIQASGYNFPEKNKPAIVLPKLQDSDQKVARNPRSLSPMLEHRRIKTSQDSLLKTSLQLFSQNMNSSKGQFNNSGFEQFPNKRFKHSMKSAQLNRNLQSGSKQRKLSEYNSQQIPKLNFLNSNFINMPNQALSQRQDRIPVLTPLQYQQLQQNQNTQISPTSSYQLLSVRPSSKQNMNLNNSSTKNINFSTSASQYYLQDNEQLSELSQIQLMQFSSLSSGNPETPELNKKISSKNIMTARQLQPIFEEKDNLPQDNIAKKTSYISENIILNNIASSPFQPKIKVPFSTQTQSQSQQQPPNQNYFFQNQNRKFLLRTGSKKTKSSIDPMVQQDKSENNDSKLLQNYTNLIIEKEIQQDSYIKNIQRFKEDIQQLRQEKQDLLNKIKRMEQEKMNQNPFVDKQELQGILIQNINLQYDELYMQFDALCERLMKNSRANSFESQVEEIENQFKNMKQHIESIRESTTYNNSQKGIQYQLQPPIRFYPPHLIKFDHSQRLGKGGFCAVFKSKVGEKEMAQKVFEYDLDECSSIMAETLEGIFNEIKILLKVNTFSNQQFIRLFGISFDIRRNEMSGRDQFIFAIFMELIGTYDKNRFITCDLKKFINSTRTKPNYIKKCIELSLQIAEGIETLYNNNIIHSDLKPQNILLDSNQNIKIIDFGTSKFNNKPYTHDTNILGFTPRYCPLEHFDMERLTPTTDVWSFGCLLFEMITGNEPWKGIKNLQDVRKALENKQSLWLHYQSQVSQQETQHINPEIIKLIEKCTSYENRPHPSYVTEKINEILQQQL